MARITAGRPTLVRALLRSMGNESVDGATTVLTIRSDDIGPPPIGSTRDEIAWKLKQDRIRAERRRLEGKRP